MKKFVFTQGNDLGYIKTEAQLKVAINNNTIKQYHKIPLLEVGEYVICCDIKNSIDPSNNKREFDSSSWKKDKVFKTEKVVLQNNIYYVTGYGARGGVYCSGIRRMTEQEVKDYQSGKHIIG